uniref:Uncharacterized protein n=1 Tax=Strombidium rassoulzadegani TaxID=1082188 RepID=A0A7S3FXU1_9SPIT|mmetsp:Transcript_4727/g.8075  ORF Transcript_4727/g.8075 Transcript_4727/m.8075 type:complete len:142 (+) Transcript_4727:164-589(+)
MLAKVSELETMTEKKSDPNWETLALELITHLQDPIHQMILSWQDWYMANNGLGSTQKWDPEHNPAHLIRSEVSDVYKAMGKIRALEAKLRNFDPNSGTTNEDWNLLNSLKRELGIPVEFAGDKAALQGPGNIESKSTAALA